MAVNSRTNIEKILSNKTPSGFVFAPNYWQWFAHHRNHGILPEELKGCETQLDMINYLGVDVFSRNIYCKQDEYWFGGICDEYFDGCQAEVNIRSENSNKLTIKDFRLSKGLLWEELLYVFDESTIVQKKFLITDYKEQGGLLEQFVSSRKWRFNKKKYEEAEQKVGDRGLIIVGDFFSPLKLLHLIMGPVNSVYFLMEQPQLAKTIMDIHENNQLDLVRQSVSDGVRVIMSMDNLDTMFHPPDYVEEYSASFYEKAASICHEHGALFFIHACGNQKDNLKLISSLKVDGLEGIAFPPLGDVELDEAMKITSENFIITGGISPIETRDLKTRQEVFNYVENLFGKLKPYMNRFIFSSSCNTAINTSWNTIKDFRDAWLEYR